MTQPHLIAGRSEIVSSTPARRGRIVADYSDADVKVLHVRQADEAVHIGAFRTATS